MVNCHPSSGTRRLQQAQGCPLGDFLDVPDLLHLEAAARGLFDLFAAAALLQRDLGIAFNVSWAAGAEAPESESLDSSSTSSSSSPQPASVRVTNSKRLFVKRLLRLSRAFPGEQWRIETADDANLVLDLGERLLNRPRATPSPGVRVQLRLDAESAASLGDRLQRISSPGSSGAPTARQAPCLEAAAKVRLVVPVNETDMERACWWRRGPFSTLGADMPDWWEKPGEVELEVRLVVWFGYAPLGSAVSTIPMAHYSTEGAGDADEGEDLQEEDDEEEEESPERGNFEDPRFRPPSPLSSASSAQFVPFVSSPAAASIQEDAQTPSLAVPQDQAQPAETSANPARGSSESSEAAVIEVSDSEATPPHQRIGRGRMRGTVDAAIVHIDDDDDEEEDEEMGDGVGGFGYYNSDLAFHRPDSSFYFHHAFGSDDPSFGQEAERHELGPTSAHLWLEVRKPHHAEVAVKYDIATGRTRFSGPCPGLTHLNASSVELQMLFGSSRVMAGAVVQDSGAPLLEESTEREEGEEEEEEAKTQSRTSVASKKRKRTRQPRKEKVGGEQSDEGTSSTEDTRQGGVGLADAACKQASRLGKALQSLARGEPVYAFMVGCPTPSDDQAEEHANGNNGNANGNCNYYTCNTDNNGNTHMSPGDEEDDVRLPRYSVISSEDSEEINTNLAAISIGNGEILVEDD